MSNDGSKYCSLCEHTHRGLEHVFPDKPAALKPKTVSKPVKEVVTVTNSPALVVHEVVHIDNVVVHKSKHGKYADKEKRREYRRNWMKGKRANA